jgi:CheY-specific phosphatase CheX
MACKFFGQFLLEQGIVSRDALLQAIDHQRAIAFPACALAISRKILTAENLATLETQGPMESTLTRALQMGVINQTQLDEINGQTAERWMYLAEALMHKGHVGLRQFGELVDQYRREQEPLDPSIGNTLGEIPEKDLVTSFLEVTVDLFLHYTRQIVQVDSVEKVSCQPDAISYVFSQQVLGDRSFSYALALPEKLVILIASHMLQEEVRSVDAMVMDAGAEFVNMIVGHGCIKLNMKNTRVTAAPPQAVMGNRLMNVLPPTTLGVRMRTAKGSFQVVFIFSQNKD